MDGVATRDGITDTAFVMPLQDLINSFTYVGFEVLTTVVMNSSVFWDITPGNPLKINRCFGGTCRLHLQARRISQERNQRECKNGPLLSTVTVMSVENKGPIGMNWG
jgi:hypothetical protein